jgi:hypothetical protein
VDKTVNIAPGVGVQMQVYIGKMTKEMTVLLHLLSSSTSLPTVEKLEGMSNYNRKFTVEIYLIHDDLWGCTDGSITRRDLYKRQVRRVSSSGM